MDEEIGESVKRALELSKSNVPHPPSYWDAEPTELLNHAGVSSWAEFHKDATHCLVEQSGASLTVYPSERRGEGFVYSSERFEVSTKAHSITIGELVRQVLTQ